MKKRLLALALCLVLATSLLPITAAADVIDLDKVRISADNVMYDPASGYKMNIRECHIYSEVSEVYNAECIGGEIYTNPSCSSILQTAPTCWNTYFVKFRIQPQNEGKYYNGDGLDAFSSALIAPGDYKTVWRKTDSEGSGVVLVFELEKNHLWQMSNTENTLTAECGHDGCPIRKVSVELKADSVTLPNSPFNARLEGWEQLLSEFPEAKYKFEYKYKAPGDSEYHIVEPTAANAKAGEYQVGVNLWDIGKTPIDPSEGTYLFVKYTVSAPAITAQTGDNRPIELMMGSVLVFSALAAAAFVLDSKRRSQP